MTQEREFDRLELFVSRLLTQFDQLRQENKRLESLLVQRETEITDLKTELSSADSAKGDITNRVRGLIEQIEEWETDIAETETVPLKNENVPVEAATESNDAGVYNDSGTAEVEEEESEGGLQQNLFNVERSTNIDG